MLKTQHIVEWKSLQDEVPKVGQWIIAMTVLGSNSKKPTLIHWDKQSEVYHRVTFPDLVWFRVPLFKS